MSAMMLSRPSIAERILLLLSKNPEEVRLQLEQSEWTVEDALSLLCDVFPNFLERISGKDILDHGCGSGYQAIALARKGAKRVIGMDADLKCLVQARAQAKEAGVDGSVEFVQPCTARWKGQFDFVISQNSMEHYPDPRGALQEMISFLKPDGTILLTFGPPWLAPYGSHMHFFTGMPWVNILFREKTVMYVRRRFRPDDAKRYEEVEFGLNKMTVARFERLVSESGLGFIYRDYRCVRQLGFLARIPAFRELFINHISCELAKSHR